MTRPVTYRKRKGFSAFNARKRQTLQVFRERGWLNPSAWAVLTGFYPIRAAYTYLLRLKRWGLLWRKLDARGLILYRLSPRGERRLLYLGRRMR